MAETEFEAYYIEWIGAQPSGDKARISDIEAEITKRGGKLPSTREEALALGVAGPNRSVEVETATAEPKAERAVRRKTKET